jgi:hypothetical protein
MARNYVIKFYNGSGSMSSDWPCHEIHIFCTYEQAKARAEDYQDRHPNIVGFSVIEE